MCTTGTRGEYAGSGYIYESHARNSLGNVIMCITGTIIGYDPGGDGKHGLAKLFIRNGLIQDAVTNTLTLCNAEQVINETQEKKSLVAVGVDTLTCWSTGPGGWRPADRWLRNQYREVQQSIVSPNGLYGSMTINGMAVLKSLRDQQPDLFITETHPKVLFWFIMQKKYDYKNKRTLMNKTLTNNLGVAIAPQNDHEWDAAISAFAALQSVRGIWQHDLHQEPSANEERLVRPCGTTHFFWPE